MHFLKQQPAAREAIIRQANIMWRRWYEKRLRNIKHLQRVRLLKQINPFQYTPSHYTIGSSAPRNNGTATNEKIVREKVRYNEYGGMDENGLRAVRLDDKWGYINWNVSQVVTIPIIYEEVKFVSKGFYGVRLNQKWGFVDKNGKILVPLQFDDIVSGFNGYATMAVVTLDGDQFTIDKTGKAEGAKITIAMNMPGYTILTGE